MTPAILTHKKLNIDYEVYKQFKMSIESITDAIYELEEPTEFSGR